MDIRKPIEDKQSSIIKGISVAFGALGVAVADDFIKVEKEEIGHMSTHADGSRWQKTGDGWRIIKANVKKNAKLEDVKDTAKPVKNDKKDEESRRKIISEYAKNSSADQLRRAIKEHADPLVREHAHIELRDRINKVKSYIMSDRASQLKLGIKIESEHKKTYNKIKAYYESRGEMPPPEMVYQWIAEDHLDEFKTYYTALQAMEEELKKIKKGEDDDIVKGAVEREEALDHPDELGAGAEKREKLKSRLDKVAVVMEEFKAGTLHSSDGKKVTDRKQAIAIAMSESGQSKDK